MRTILAAVLVLLVLAAPVYGQEDQEAIIAKIMDSGEAEVTESITSPNGEWMAEITVYDCVDVDGQLMAYETLDVTVGETKTTVATQLIACQGLGAFGLSMMHWSENGEYLYYTDAREGVPDGGGFWLRPLIRVQISDMTTLHLGNGLFSPTWTMFAGWNQGLTVWDLNNGEQLAQFESSVPDMVLTQLAWLPDGSGLIYILGEANMFPSTRAVVVHTDVETGEQDVLLETGE